MAKPIRATPTLKGQDAKNFVRDLLNEQANPNPNRINFIKESQNTKFNFNF
jgi:hypothetical protein